MVKKRFTVSVTKLLVYLENEWAKKVADNFLAALEERIDTLAHQPFIGSPSGIKNARAVLISKHNRFYYRVKGCPVEIMALIDTRMDPEKNRYQK